MTLESNKKKKFDENVENVEKIYQGKFNHYQRILKTWNYI